MKTRCKILLVTALWAVLPGPHGCMYAAGTNLQKLDFGIFWPILKPALAEKLGRKALLNGCVSLQLNDTPGNEKTLGLRITLTRPSDEDGRTFWNSQLAYNQYDGWMKYLRVWDADKKWLWPNLPYLLKVRGVARIERYGGIDPGKGVDNDFAGVLIRTYDLSGENESETTRDEPLVSAEWYPAGVTNADKFTVVHTAQSDEFTLNLGKTGARQQGQAGVWLIYADFMGSRIPDDWPKTKEFEGGILAFFELKWQMKPSGEYDVNIQQAVPKRSTGFDWEEWSDEAHASPENTASKLEL